MTTSVLVFAADSSKFLPKIEEMRQRVAEIPETIKTSFQIDSSKFTRNAAAIGQKISSAFSNIDFSSATSAFSPESISQGFSAIGEQARAIKQDIKDGLENPIEAASIKLKQGFIVAGEFGKKGAVAGARFAKSFISSTSVQNVGKRISDSVLSGIEKVSATKLASRLELGSTFRALESEVDASFSAETVGRKIFSSIFSFSPASGQIGFIAGKYAESFGDVAKKTVSLSSRFVGFIGKGLTSLIAGAFSAENSKIARGIQATVGIVTKGFEGITNTAISTLQFFINKRTVALFTSLSVGIVKKTSQIFLSLGSKISNQIKGLFGRIRGIFGQFFGGTAGGFAQELGGSFTPFELFGLGSVAGGVKLAANLEEQLLNVSTITGQVGQSLKSTGQDVVELSNTFGKSATEIGKSLFFVSSAGFKGSEGIEVLNQALAGSKASATDVNTFASGLVKTLNAFGRSAKDAGRFTDIIFNIRKRGIVGADLTTQLGRVNAVANSLGIEFREVGAVFANLTRRGLTSAQAATGISAALSAIIKQSDSGVKEIEKLGLSFTANDIAANGFIGTIQKLAPAIVQNQKEFTKFFGSVEGFKAVSSLAQDILRNPTGDGSLQQDLDLIAQQGSAIQAAATVASGFNEQMRLFFTRFGNILRNIGQAFLPTALSGLNFINDQLGRIAKFANLDFKAFSDSIVKNSGKIIGSLKDSAVSVLEFIGTKALKVAFGLVSGFAKISGKIADLSFKKIGSALVNGIKRLAVIVRDGVRDFFTFDFFKDSQPQQVKPDSETLQNLFSDFGTAFDRGSNELFGKFLNDKSFSDTVGQSFNNTVQVFSSAISDISKAPVDALVAQGDRINEVIIDLEKQNVEAIRKGDDEKSGLIQQQIATREQQLKTIESQIKKSPVTALSTQLLKISKQIISAQNQGDVELENQLLKRQRRLQSLIRSATSSPQGIEKINKSQSSASNVQIKSVEQLTNRAKALSSATFEASSNFSKLTQILDQTFGKEVESIFKRLGVGGEIAAARTATRDVLVAKQAGFSQRQIDQVVTRSFSQTSPLLGQFFSAVEQLGGDAFSINQVKSEKLQQPLVAFLDKLEALGASEDARRNLFRGRLTDAAFKELDSLTADDKQTDFIEQVVAKFQNLEQSRKLQERRNAAQLKIAKLTNNIATDLDRERQKTIELEQLARDLEQRVRSGEQVAAAAGGIGG